MNFTRLFQAVCLALFISVSSAAQPPASTEMPDWQIAAGRELFFQVATVKPNTSDSPAEVNFTLGPGDAYSDSRGRFLAKNISLLDYIRFAYKLTDGQVEILQASGPKWIETEHFDVEAKSDIANPTKNQMRLMMQSLLADRFKLSVHTEMREVAVLALVLAKPGKLGPQLHPHSPADDKCSSTIAATDPATPQVCGGLMSVGVPSSPSHVRIGGRQVSLALIAAHLGEMGGFGRPVVDLTGLSGTFDFTLEWGPDSVTEPPGGSDRQTYLLEALKDQLGLKLENRKSSVTVLLIDHVNQRPAEN
jgi:uncharacterized protein (TIGR03435 family)